MSLPSYSILAKYYDTLNSGVNYAEWADFICGFFSRGAREISRVLDMGCGTGNMTLELARRGYNLIGADISIDMLAEARRRSDAEGLDVLYIVQDMRELDLFGSFDAVVCCLDGINYITETAGLLSCFSGVHKFLGNGGIFMFDVNTPYKFNNIYACNDYILEDKKILCAWRNQFNKSSGLCRFYLSVFEQRKDGAYDRLDEMQTERCYSMRTIKKLLYQAGFADTEVYGSFDHAAVSETDERWYFVCRKS